jgi:hypothetical protein
MTCECCEGSGFYPIISAKGSHLFDIKCPVCFGISDEELERRAQEDRAALEAWLLGNKTDTP